MCGSIQWLTSLYYLNQKHYITITCILIEKAANISTYLIIFINSAWLNSQSCNVIHIYVMQSLSEVNKTTKANTLRKALAALDKAASPTLFNLLRIYRSNFTCYK